MLLHHFLYNFDFPGSVILLEGKRQVKNEDKLKLVRLGKLLCESSECMIFRSGNAPGADDLFMEGVNMVNPNRIQLITPYSGHRKKPHLESKMFHLDHLDIANEQEVIQQTASLDNNQYLVDKYLHGKGGSSAIKAAYLLRDTVKVLGTKSGLDKAGFACFYDDLDNPISGGTGHTIKICDQNKVPHINQSVWFDWLN